MIPPVDVPTIRSKTVARERGASRRSRSTSTVAGMIPRIPPPSIASTRKGAPQRHPTTVSAPRDGRRSRGGQRTHGAPAMSKRTLRECALIFWRLGVGSARLVLARPERGALVLGGRRRAAVLGGCGDGGAGRPPAGATSLEGPLGRPAVLRAAETATSPARTPSRWSRSGNAPFRRPISRREDGGRPAGEPRRSARSRGRRARPRARGGARSPRSGDPGSPCDATCRGGVRGPAGATVRAREDREAPQRAGTPTAAHPPPGRSPRPIEPRSSTARARRRDTRRGDRRAARARPDGGESTRAAALLSTIQPATATSSDRRTSRSTRAPSRRK